MIKINKLNIQEKSFIEFYNKIYTERLISKYTQVSKEELLSNGVIIYGIADYSKLVIAQLAKYNIKPEWIVDKNIEPECNNYAGIDVKPISSLTSTGNCYVLLASTHIKEKARICQEYGVNKWITAAALRDWCSISGDFGICMTDKRYDSELLQAYHLMEDDKSCDIFKAFIRWHHTFYNDFSRLRDPIPFFPDDLRDKIDYSFFVDIGAFTGDTLIEYIANVDTYNQEFTYYAFEPDCSSFNMLNSIINKQPLIIRENIYTINAALGKTDGYVTIDGAEGGYTINSSDSGNNVQCKCVDDIFKDYYPTIIKADIEGSEMDMLHGAENTIRRCRPTLAISVYHRYSDIWSIPLWISSLNLGYKIYLRHFPNVFTDTTCFAIQTQ